MTGFDFIITERNRELTALRISRLRPDTISRMKLISIISTREFIAHRKHSTFPLQKTNQLIHFGK
jgi:hypothetical protein